VTALLEYLDLVYFNADLGPFYTSFSIRPVIILYKGGFMSIYIIS